MNWDRLMQETVEDSPFSVFKVLIPKLILQKEFKQKLLLQNGS